MYTQAENTHKNRKEFVIQESRPLRQAINIVDNRSAGIIQKNIIPGEEWTQTQMVRHIPTCRSNQVMQLAKLRLGIRDMNGWDKDKMTKFSVYVKQNGWSIDKFGREVDTGETGPETVKDLIMGFNAFLSQTGEEQVVAVTREDVKKKQTGDVKAIMDLFKAQYYPDAREMTGLDGKRNAGIYEIPPSESTPYPLIAKLIYKSERMEETEDERMAGKFGQIQLYRKYNPQPDEGWELCVPEGEYMYVGKGPDFTIYIVLYKKMPGQTLEKHIQDKTKLNLSVIGRKVAFFHLSAMKSTGQYIIHKDLNTANIMLDESGFMGLVDTDDVGYTNDPACVKADISTLLNMVINSMKREKYPPETVEATINEFVSGYEEIMKDHDSKLVGEIKKDVREKMVS